MEPVRFEQFPSSFLFAPLRRDILHKAVVFEGDAHRLGRGSAKTRAEVHGSGRKIRPQKGTGCARLGNRKSPMLRGGGAAHGPKPRDFSSDLPRKMYAMAWRTALSYRYRRSELVLVAGPLELMAADHSLALAILATHRWGNDGHRSLFVAAQHRPNLAEAMEPLGAEGRLLTVDEVDVKDLVPLSLPPSLSGLAGLWLTIAAGNGPSRDRGGGPAHARSQARPPRVAQIDVRCFFVRVHSPVGGRWRNNYSLPGE